MKPLAVARRLFCSCFCFLVVILQSKKWKGFCVCWLTRKPWQWFHSLPGCLPSFCFFLGLPRPTTAWHGNEMGRRGQWHQRTDIKRQAQLDPATIARCGHAPSRHAPRAAGTAAGQPPVSPLPPVRREGAEKGPFPLTTCVTADGYLSRGGRGEGTQRNWSVMALG